MIEVVTPDLRRALIMRPPVLHDSVCRAPCRVVAVRTVWIRYHWNRAPEEMRVRSGEVEPSVAADGETAFESISTAVGEVSAPPLADQPKLGKYYDQMISARVLSRRGMRRPKRVCCWPRKGTPSGACETDPAKTCRKHGCWTT